MAGRPAEAEQAVTDAPTAAEMLAAELAAAANEIDRVIAATRARLAGGELERRREEIVRRARQRGDS